MPSERWVPRCRSCGHTTIMLMPTSCGPEQWGTSQPQLYCPDCQAIYDMIELTTLYVRL